MKPMPWCALLLVGCGQAAILSPTATTTTTAAEVEQVRGSYDGLTMFIATSLETLTLTSAQDARLASIDAKLRAKAASVHDDEVAVLAVLADGIATGTVDRAKVESGIVRLRVDATTVYSDATDALNDLHAILTPRQRAVLMADVAATWRAWQETHPSDDAALAVIAGLLGLGAEQFASARERLASIPVPALDVAGVSRQLGAFEAAFVSESFDARTTARGTLGPELTAWPVSHVVRLCEVLEGALTPAQRRELARLLRATI